MNVRGLASHVHFISLIRFTNGANAGVMDMRSVRSDVAELSFVQFIIKSILHQ